MTVTESLNDCTKKIDSCDDNYKFEWVALVLLHLIPDVARFCLALPRLNVLQTEIRKGKK